MAKGSVFERCRFVYFFACQEIEIGQHKRRLGFVGYGMPFPGAGVDLQKFVLVVAAVHLNSTSQSPL